MSIAIYTLTSELHDERSVEALTKEFLASLSIKFDYKGSDFTDYGNHSLSLLYVRTGGTEGIFKRLLPSLLKKSRSPFYLLTSGKSNSLAASMEILSFLRQQGLRGEILHGSAQYIKRRIETLLKIEKASKQLQGTRLGVIGKPSDWLISSDADYNKVRERLGIELIDIPMQELMDAIDDCDIHEGLKRIIAKFQLNGFTLRCFDLLTSLKSTGCFALAKLNSEGYVAGCEGDVPAMISMMIIRSLTGVSGFQANPARINPETGELLFAHCTIPLNMVERYELDTHFESGIGIGVRGYMKEGPVTLFKVSGDLTRHFVAEGTLIQNTSEPDLCRTQQIIRLTDKSQASYFLTEPIGNHHIVAPGHIANLLEELITSR